MCLPTVSPSPGIDVNGGYISLSFLTFQIVASDSCKSTFRNFIPLHDASKAIFRD